VSLANRYDISLEEAFLAKEARNELRAWELQAALGASIACVRRSMGDLTGREPKSL
jgi:hypothetical protein